MSSTKSRKACVNCYQKKVRCNWSEASQICSYCTSHGLQCYLPDPTQPAQRIAVRDKLAEFDARLRRLEEETRKNSIPLTGPALGFQNSLAHTAAALGDGQTSNWEVLEGDADFMRPLASRNNSDGTSSAFSSASGGAPIAQVASSAPQTSTEVLDPLADSNTQLSSATWIPEVNHPNSETQSIVRRFRGETSPWNVLASRTAEANTAFIAGHPSFNETVARLAEEESSTKSPIGRFHYDLLKDFPILSPEIVMHYAQDYADEAPFPIVFWPSLKLAISQGVTTKRWSGSGEVVCTLLYLAFGSAHSRIALPACSCEVYFQRAWNMLPQLLFEQDLWALKGLTLMVHYLQGGSLPEPCYTLLGSASRMAISLGFHRKHRDKVYSAIEEEEGKRCWWLCYILEKTFSLVLGRPSTQLEITEVEIPQPFTNLIGNSLSFFLGANDLPEHSDLNDEEAVCLFVDLIEVVRTREEILQMIPARNPNGEAQVQFSTKHESVAEILSHWRVTSRLRRPLDFDTSNKPSLRATISDLSHYNSIISLDRHLKRDFESSMSKESIQAARATIRLVAESSTDGMTMCLWMWLYYTFSAAVVLFLDVIQNPLSKDATLNLALISDLEHLCSTLAQVSPGAKRVMDVSREMNKAAFEVMKARAKRRAQDDLDEGNSIQSRFKQRRTNEPEGTAQDGMASEAHTSYSRAGAAERQEAHPLNAFPANFLWDDWGQWLNETEL